jgi:hypothetical protein
MSRFSGFEESELFWRGTRWNGRCVCRDREELICGRGY